MMLCSRGPFFQKESPRNEIKGVDWFLVLIGKKAKMATGTRKGKGANRLKKFARKWICEGIALAELRRTLNTSTRKGRKADGPLLCPSYFFPFSGCFLFVVSLSLVSVVQDSVTRGSEGWFFFILERSRNYIFNRNLFTKFFYFSFYKILTLLFLSKESEGSWVGRYFFEVPLGGKDSSKRFLLGTYSRRIFFSSWEGGGKKSRQVAQNFGQPEGGTVRLGSRAWRITKGSLASSCNRLSRSKK